MSLATDIRTRAEEALDRTTTTVTDTVSTITGELRTINVNDVTSRARELFAAVPTVDVPRLVGTVEGYRKAAQDSLDELLHADPRVGKVADTVEGYRKSAQDSVELLFDQLRQQPHVGKVIDTVDEKLVKPARARFVGIEDDASNGAEGDTENDAATVVATEVRSDVRSEAPVQVQPAPAKPARKAPARKTARNA